MQGLMMDYQLNIPAILRRAEALFTTVRSSRGSLTRAGTATPTATSCHARSSSRSRCAALGLEDGDRVGTFMWNHHEHLETYLGAPVGGFVTHTLNLRLHPDDNTYIASHAGDRVLIVDKVLWPLAENFLDRVGFEHVIAVGAGDTPDGAIDFEELLASADEGEFAYRDIDERAAAAMCYTSGTTGLPKGVMYSHRAIAIHALGACCSASTTPTPCCRSCRCSTPTRGDSRSRARWSAPSRSSPARTSTRRACSTRSWSRR